MLLIFLILLHKIGLGKYSKHFAWKQLKRILRINKVFKRISEAQKWKIRISLVFVNSILLLLFQSTLKLITTKLRFLPRLGRKLCAHRQSISFCHASLAQFASGDDALLQHFGFFSVSLWKVSLVQFFRWDRECFGSFDDGHIQVIIFHLVSLDHG